MSSKFAVGGKPGYYPPKLVAGADESLVPESARVSSAQLLRASSVVKSARGVEAAGCGVEAGASAAPLLRDAEALVVASSGDAREVAGASLLESLPVAAVSEGAALRGLDQKETFGRSTGSELSEPAGRASALLGPSAHEAEAAAGTRESELATAAARPDACGNRSSPRA